MLEFLKSLLSAPEKKVVPIERTKESIEVGKATVEFELVDGRKINLDFYGEAIYLSEPTKSGDYVYPAGITKFLAKDKALQALSNLQNYESFVDHSAMVGYVGKVKEARIISLDLHSVEV